MLQGTEKVLLPVCGGSRTHEYEVEEFTPDELTRTFAFEKMNADLERGPGIVQLTGLTWACRVPFAGRVVFLRAV